MIELKENTSGSTVGPIIVMIDANRLSHSLTTALKDRPHGIPSQPNRSLPLRPPPPIPVRIPVVKSPKNSGVTQTNTTQQITENGESCGKSIAESNTANNSNPRSEVVGMNFYDSKNREVDSNDKFGKNLSENIPKDIGKIRNTKSLDSYRSNESICGNKRRKSLDYETVCRSGDSKKRNTSYAESVKSDTEIVKKEKEGQNSCGIKRKSWNQIENCDPFKKKKSPKNENFYTKNLDESEEMKSNEPTEHVLDSKNIEGIEGSGIELPIIYKYRYSQSVSTSSKVEYMNTEAPDCRDEKASWKQTSSNTHIEISPKSMVIPKCPVTIPIEVAHAINQGKSRDSNIYVNINDVDIIKSRKSNGASTISQCDSMKPKINTEMDQMHIPVTVEEIENTLPSMPSLEDMMQFNSSQDQLLLRKCQVDTENAEANVTSEPTPMVQARVLQVPSNVAIDTNNLHQAINDNTNTIPAETFDKLHESINNLTTVLEIKIPGRSPELFVVQTPQVTSSGKADDTAIISPVEATTLESLSSDLKPAVEEVTRSKTLKETDPLSQLMKFGTENHSDCQICQENKLHKKDITKLDFPTEFSLNTGSPRQQCADISGADEPQYMLQHKSPGKYEILIKNNCSSLRSQRPALNHRKRLLSARKQKEITDDSRSKRAIETDMVRCRRNKQNSNLKKLYEEEAKLKLKMSQTNIPSRLARLQQKINCAQKRIENTQKYLSKLISIERTELNANAAPSRIQVRRDLVQEIPSPVSAEPPLKSPLRPTNETDKASTGRSPPDFHTVVITLSETDSISSGEETDINNRKSSGNIEPFEQLDVEIKLNNESMPDNDTKVVSTMSDALPDIETNYASLLNPITADIASINSQVPRTTNTDSISVPPICTNANNNSTNILDTTLSTSTPHIPVSAIPALLSIPQVPVSANTDSASIPPISTSTNIDRMRIPSLIRDPINYSLNNFSGLVNQKSLNEQRRNENPNLSPTEIVEERRNQKCNISQCLQCNLVPPTNLTAKCDESKINPSVNDLRTPSTIRRMAIQEYTNNHPVPNHPVHRPDYASTGNVQSMFSRDNGGANIKLSSPLQGHSALPPTPPRYRNMTAQGYPIPAEPSSNHQTAQWYNQHPPAQSSVQFTPDRDVSPKLSILAAHLLKPQAQEPLDFCTSSKLSSTNQSKDTTRTNEPSPMNKHVTASQFPSLGNWAAQMTRESINRQVVNNSTANKTDFTSSGSDMYKMTANTVNPVYSTNPENPIYWQPGKPCSEQPRHSNQGLSSHRNIPQSYRRDYLPNSQIPPNCYNGPARYPGSEEYMPYSTNSYRQVPSEVHCTQGVQRSSNQSPEGHQNMRHYQSATLSTQHQGNSAHLMNSVGMMQQQYVHQPPPPAYPHSMLSQWHSANNYHKNYDSLQYNAFNVPPQPMENNSSSYRQQTNKNQTASTQQQQQQHHHNNHNHHMPHHLIQNISGIRLPNSVYNVSGHLNTIAQSVRNSEVLDHRGSSGGSRVGKVNKNSDKSNNLKYCSLCGTPGSKFSCVGCGVAFYCNEHCQMQHWGAVHYIECHKKMPKLKKVS